MIRLVMKFKRIFNIICTVFTPPKVPPKRTLSDRIYNIKERFRYHQYGIGYIYPEDVDKLRKQALKL